MLALVLVVCGLLGWWLGMWGVLVIITAIIAEMLLGMWLVHKASKGGD